MGHHEIGEHRAIDQDDPRGDAIGVLDGLRAEVTRCDEDAPTGLCSVQGANEFLELRPPDRPRRGVSLCLYVDAVKAEGILPDDPV